MHRTMEEYESHGSEDKRSWIWSKAVSVGKKVLTAGVVVSSAPLFVPPLIVASTIAFFSSVPFCLFLANYACTQKLMSSLLPATDETGGIENEDESGFGEYSKLCYGEGVYEGDEDKSLMPILTQVEDDEKMAKESTSLLEKIRDEGRTERDLQDGEKSENSKEEKVQDQPGKQELHETVHEGEVGTKGKDEEASSNEPIDQASGQRGTGEEKPKNTTKKKKKTGRAGV